ncbi:MAG: hypothetical protein FWF02_06150 [Micrococcales bacterium]|nr:hypothetical protein [Micrococcales bacterium]MCL2667273.1 hypothetical protein [Micrococcales bacterium]
MTLTYIKATGVVARLRADDRGQGSLEYVGIVLAAIALCGVVAMFLKTELGTIVVDALKNAVGSLGGTDGGTDGPP